MPYTDTNVTNLIVNVLDKDTYDGLTPNNDELYLITDDTVMGGCYVYTTSSISSLPASFTVSGVNSNCVVVNSVLSHPSAQTSDWTVTTSNDATNNVTISGSISGSTTVTLYFVIQAS